jgi:hypothetical protein
LAKYDVAETCSIQDAAANLAEKAFSLIQECLLMDEEDRAMAVYRSLETLPYAEPSQVNNASKLLVERLVKNGRDSEARALANSRLERLPPNLSIKYQSQIDRLIKPTPNNQKGKALTSR